MRVLVLGGTGMLGHKLWQVCSEKHETYAAVRGTGGTWRKWGIFNPDRLVEGVTADAEASVAHAIALARPDVVINCIGIVKQSSLAADPVTSIRVNALLPHLLARRCAEHGTRLVHISTDCVFSGRKGRYAEDDLPDPDDLYGRTKLLGEVVGEGCVTIRTSMIGRELASSNGLVEWFLAQSAKGGVVRGYRRAVFSGFTTLELSRIIRDVVLPRTDLGGLWHVASEPISKLDLLAVIKQTYGLKTVIEPDDEVVCDRSLDGSRLRGEAGFVPSPWGSMIQDMYNDPTPYSRLRRTHDRG